MTDETIYVWGHRDGWFEAAGDNGTAVGGSTFSQLAVDGATPCDPPFFPMGNLGRRARGPVVCLFASAEKEN